MKTLIMRTLTMKTGSYRIFLLIFLGLLTAFGPFVTDMYLPALPAMIDMFGTNTSMVQLSLTSCMVGLAAGQLLFGPMSDRYGRKPVLSWTLFLFILSTLLCLFSADIYLFVIFRLFQGIAAAGSIVIPVPLIKAKPSLLLIISGTIKKVNTYWFPK